MQRQKNQMMLNLGTGVLGEAQNAAAQETEIGAAEACLERPAVTGPSMESVVERASCAMLTTATSMCAVNEQASE